MKTAKDHAKAAAAIAMLAASDAMPTPRKGSARTHKPTPPPRMDTALAREIAEHNAKVDAKKAERALRRLADKNPGY